MTTKRILNYLIIVFLSVLSYSTFAQSVTISVEDIETTPGTQNVPLIVNLDNTEADVAGVQIEFAYDATGIHMVNETVGLTERTNGFTGQLTVTENGENSSATLLMYSMTGDAIPAGTGNIFEVYFNVDEGAVNTNVQITEALISNVTFTNLDVTNNAENISFTTGLEANSCTNPFLYGNINSDAVSAELTEAGDFAWYSVILDQDYELVEFSLCGSDFDTKLEIWETCDAANYLAYNDDNSDVCGTGGNSNIILENLTAGTYFVKVYDYSSNFGNYELSITEKILSNEANFLAFTLEGIEAVINAEEYTITVEGIPYGTDLTDLNASYTLSDGATTSIQNNFSELPVTYIVTAEDGVTTQEWTVTEITLEENPCLLAVSYGDINGEAVSAELTEAGDFAWYSIVLDQNYENLEFSTCNSNFDTDLEVWGSCDAENYLVYQDFADPKCGLNYDDNYWASSINLDYLVAGTYYVKVFGFSNNYGNYELNITGDIPPPPGTCNYSVVLKDYSSDGWGTNTLTVYVDGEQVSLLTSTTAEETFEIPVQDYNIITTVFTAGEDGDDYECAYEIYDVLGVKIYSYDIGTNEETGTNEITVNCQPEAEPVTNLTADALNADVQLNWNLNELGDEVYVAYSSENEFSENVEENEMIYNGTETSFSHTDLAEGTHYYSIWSLNAAGVYSVAVLTEVTITPSCNYSVVLMDTYGDGWGTNTLSVFVDGLEVLTEITSTTEEESFDISARTNDIITAVFTAGNDDDDYECSYKILDVLGNEVYSYDVGTETETGNSEIEVNCEPEASPVTDLSAEVISETEISLTWNLNELGDEVYVAYNSVNEFSEVIEDNNIIYSGTETSFTHTDLAEGTHYYSVWSLNAVGIYSVESTVNATIYGLGEDCSKPVEFTFNGDAQTGSITSYGSAWYSVVLDDIYANVEFSLCNSEFDTKIEVWANCDAENYIEYDDDDCTGTTTSIITLPNLESGTYLVRVYGYNNNFGNYELSITGQEYIAPVTDLNATIIEENTGLQLDWVLNNNSNNVVVVYNNLDDFGTPENGTAYEIDGMIGTATVLYVGDETSFNHNNLDLGNYYYQVWSVNEDNNYSIASEISEELMVAPVTDLTTEVLSDTEIKLDWILNDLGNNIVLAYNTTNVFGETPNDLDENTTILYDNVNEITFTHTGLDFGTYYYKIWSIDANGNYSTAELISESIYSEGQDCTTALTYGNINDASVTGDILNAGDAVWYEVTLDKSYENVEISTCNSNFDTDLQIWRNCDDATYLTYTDFGTPRCGESGDDNYYASKMNLDYLFEGTYYVKVYGYENSTGNYELSITGEEAITCDYTLNLDVLATATDGWEGNTLSVYINDMLLGDFTVDAENSEFTIPVNTTNVISTIFADNNGDGYNCTYTISDVLGNVVYTEGEDTPIAGLESLIADCNPDVETITNLEANVLDSETEIEVTWNLNELGDNVIVAYNTGNDFGTPEEGMTYSVNGLLGNATIIYVGNETSITLDNLEAGNHNFSVWAFNSLLTYSDETLTDAHIYGPGDLCTDPFAYGNINDPSVTGEIVNAGNAVWYTVVLDNSYKNVEFSLCGSDFDTKLEVWRNCDDENYIAYNDDASPSCGNSASKINLDYLSTGTYYVKVYAFQNNTGNYQLSVIGEEAIPCNYTLNLYEFDNAIEGWTANTLNVYVNGLLVLENVTIDGENTEFNIPVNTTNLITTTFADNDGNGYECYYTISDVLGNVVYTDGLDNIISGITEGIEADCNPDAEPITDLNALVLESNTEIELNWNLNEANNDVVIAYNDNDDFGTPEEGVTYIAGDMIGNSEVVFVGNATTFTMNNLEAGDHSFAVWSVNIANGYSDELKVTDVHIYAPGELCTDPLAYGNINDPVKFGNVPAGGEVWYTVDIDDQDYLEIEFSLCNSSFDTKIEVWNTCDDVEYIAYNDDACGLQSNIVFSGDDLLTAGTYLVKVFGYNTADGNYNLNITGRMASTENDILDFTFGNVSVSTEIDNENYNINCFVLEGTDLTDLTPEMNISEYATIDTYTDFSSTVNYNVTAEDGSIQIWNVNVEALVGAPDVQVAVGEVSACVGENVDIPVTMKFASDIGAITLFVEYDNTLLTYNDYNSVNDEISGALVNDDNGVIGIAWYSPDNGADLYEETTLLNLNFTYLGGGNAILDINNEDNEIANMIGTELTLDLSNGEVNANPTANITTHPMDINVCNDTEAVFNVVADNVIAYQWQVNTGSDWVDIDDSNPTSNSNQLVVNATNSDNENMYRCLLKNEEECEIQTEEVTLTVMPTPEAEISLVEADEICDGEEVAINVTFTDGTAPYSITYTDGTNENTINNINENPYTFNVQTAGEYELVSASDATCEANVSGTANVEYREIPTATLSGNYGICNGEEANITINFTGNQPFSVTYMYASNTITIAEIYTDAYTFIVNQVGTYQLLGVTDMYCTGVANGSAEIIAVSKPTATFGADANIVEGETASLEVNFTGYAPYDFVYTDGMGMEYNATSETNTFVLEIAPEETTTYTLLSVNDANCSNNDIDDQATVNVTPLINISGKVVYNNEHNIGLVGIDVQLNGYVNGTQVTFETETDNEGNYEFNVQNGTYTVTASENYIYPTWNSAANATDALLAAKYGIGIVSEETGPLTDFQVEIGNVNDNMNLNSTDALMIIMRWMGEINEFPTGDWAFETKTVIAENSDIVVENLNAACYGDIDASYYTAAAKKAERNISLINSGVLEVQSSTFEMPIKATENMELGAVTLVIEYPNDIVEVKSVNSKLEGLRYNVIDNKIHVAWYNTNSANIKANEDLISLELLRINEGNISLNISNESEFANADAKVLKNKVLTTPSIELSTVKGLEFSISNYPNPFISETTIEYTLTEDAKVQLTVYDITGKEIVKLVNENQAKGVHTQEFDANELSNGMYLYEIKVKSENSEYRKINKMTVNK